MAQLLHRRHSHPHAHVHLCNVCIWSPMSGWLIDDTMVPEKSYLVALASGRPCTYRSCTFCTFCTTYVRAVGKVSVDLGCNYRAPQGIQPRTRVANGFVHFDRMFPEHNLLWPPVTLCSKCLRRCIGRRLAWASLPIPHIFGRISVFAELPHTKYTRRSHSKHQRRQRASQSPGPASMHWT